MVGYFPSFSELYTNKMHTTQIKYVRKTMQTPNSQWGRLLQNMYIKKKLLKAWIWEVYTKICLTFHVGKGPKISQHNRKKE